jgi:hypothetical protein
MTLGTRSWPLFGFGRGGDARRYREIHLAAEVERMMARGQVAEAAVLRERGLVGLADVGGVAAARVEATAGGRRDRAWRVAFQHDLTQVRRR